MEVFQNITEKTHLSSSPGSFVNLPIKIMKISETSSIIAATAAISFALLGFFSNLLTICAMIRSPKLYKQTTTWFIISLSISDMIFCSFNLPLTATRYIFKRWIFSDLLCKLFPFIFYANFGVSLLHSLLIAINRYVLITKNSVYYKIYTPFNRGVMIAMIWIIPILLLLLPLFGVWGSMGHNPNTHSCTILEKEGKSPKKVIFIFGIIPPFIIVFYCYIAILIRVRQSKEALRKTCQSSGVVLNLQQKDEHALLKTMILIFGLFMICFLPTLIVNAIEEKVKNAAIHIFTSMLAWFSGTVNPIIYLISSKQYREAYVAYLSS